MLFRSVSQSRYIDDDVVGPFATSLYMLNLKYNPDKEIKGDAKVIARGASGLMEKELKKNDMLEAAQIVASLAQTGRVNPEAIDKAVDRVLVTLDLVDTDMDQALENITGGEEQPAQVDPMAMMQQAQQPQHGSPEQMAQAQMMVQ